MPLAAVSFCTAAFCMDRSYAAQPFPVAVLLQPCDITGYISYSVDWIAMSADQFGIISFDRGNVLFAKDVYKVICNLFEIYGMNRISWRVYVDNPAIRGYRKFIEKHGGRECGYYRQNARLQDGRLHDSVEFEILSCEFERRRRGCRN